MSALASLSPMGEKQEVVLVMHCKGVNNLDKVVLCEIQGSSPEVLGCHSRSVACALPGDSC
jgi:glucose-6-phosphate 1-epimerase